MEKKSRPVTPKFSQNDCTKQVQNTVTNASYMVKVNKAQEHQVSPEAMKQKRAERRELRKFKFNVPGSIFPAMTVPDPILNNGGFNQSPSSSTLKPIDLQANQQIPTTSPTKRVPIKEAKRSPVKLQANQTTPDINLNVKIKFAHRRSGSIQTFGRLEGYESADGRDFEEYVAKKAHQPNYQTQAAFTKQVEQKSRLS